MGIDTNKNWSGFSINNLGGLGVSGNIDISGTVDGVDVSAFKSAYDVHTHSTYDYNTALTGANVFSNITVADGITTGLTTRALTASDIGASESGHTHAYVARAGATLDNTLVRWNGASVDSIQESNIVIDDDDNLTTLGTITINKFKIQYNDTDTALEFIWVGTP